METKNKLGQEPAFPSLDVTDGMSKRFYAACAAMQGIISYKGMQSLTSDKEYIKRSYEFADELLRQENL